MYIYIYMRNTRQIIKTKHRGGTALLNVGTKRGVTEEKEELDDAKRQRAAAQEMTREETRNQGAMTRSRTRKLMKEKLQEEPCVEEEEEEEEEDPKLQTSCVVVGADARVTGTDGRMGGRCYVRQPRPAGCPANHWLREL